MEKIGEPVAASLVVESVEDGLAFAEQDRLSGRTCVRPIPWAAAAAVSPITR